MTMMVMDEDAGLDRWDYVQFDGSTVGDENLSMGVDEFLDLLGEDADPDPVKSSSENVSLMEVLTGMSVPVDGPAKDLQNEGNVFQVPALRDFDLLLEPSNRKVESHGDDQTHLLDINYPLTSLAKSSSADCSVFDSLGHSLRSNFSPSTDSEWHYMLNGSSYSFPSNEATKIGMTTDAIRFDQDFEYSSTEILGASWQSTSPFVLDEIPAQAGSGYGSENECDVSRIDGNYANCANAQPVCWPSQTEGEMETSCVKDEGYDFSRPQFAKLVKEDSSSALSCISRDTSKRSLDILENGEKEERLTLLKRPRSADVTDAFKRISSIENGGFGSNSSRQCIADCQLSMFGKKHPGFTYNGMSKLPSQPHKVPFYSSNCSPESTQSNSVDCRSHDDDSDICIIEERSHPSRLNCPVAIGNTANSHGAHDYCKVGVTRPRVNSEQLVFQVALQDLSQPKSEDSPPAGVLAVPLLRHQRIALSWMVKKETAINCSGGILADDQGLGKTVSTIALILTERPPSFRSCQQYVKLDDIQNLDSDSDDDNDDFKVSKMNDVKPSCDLHHVSSNGTLERNQRSLAHGNGRPAAGTLVVCPTSVLRQWAEELQSKVSDAARLSVLVYHGGNRTKDPLDLTKYDVVLTTYSIVSMEVPKQPLVDKDDDDRGRLDDLELPPRKENYPAKKKKSKDGKIGNALLESVAGPLAKVGWFRVVLDEAQSIKNHKTQVARACWGLRAKRRWCLSGTPIQNAIDDLYSYFRFLRYDPYAVYKTFCATIKAPIQRSPTKGYKKLQAILKTIMLRRTKGTLLDGEPIITLPPKIVELKKVEFSDEERDFYLKLEADSRAQFEEYAAAGTVKENYVNILLMLLRLRQACDHPLLVKGYASNSSWKSSVEMARKLPRERQMHLLNCLEASLAICSICNDPPEEAVVSVCGHVFCNQCVSEHLNGDNAHCAALNCKAKLTMSSVFSRASLCSALSGMCGLDSSTEHMEAVYSENNPFASSKIKAALEVLLSLSKNEKNSAVIGANDVSLVNVDDVPNVENLAVAKSSSNTKKPTGEKAIVFSQWTGMLDLLEACLKDSSIQYRRLDGTMSVVARDKAVKDFNTVPEVTVMIMSLKAASLGLNMVSACHVLLLDLWWNPTTEDQAIDRAHRIGQTRPVTVLRLTVKDTVEDRILALQEKKRVMVASAFGEDETGSRQTRLTVEDMTYLFMA